MERVSDNAVKSSEASDNNSEIGTGAGKLKSDSRTTKESSSNNQWERGEMSRSNRKWWSKAVATDFCMIINLNKQRQEKRIKGRIIGTFGRYPPLPSALSFSGDQE